MGDLVLAYALLTAPAGTPAPVVDDRTWPAVRDGLQTLAVAWEVMDEREKRYVAADPKSFQADLDTLRGRAAELADAPRVDDCHRFPPRDQIAAAGRFNRAFRCHLRTRAEVELDRLAELDAATAEADALFRVWDAARDAACPFYYTHVRRRALKALRDEIGDEAFAVGELPPVAPFWRFNETR